MKGLHVVTYGLVIIGALNWGLVGLFEYNLATTVFGATGLALESFFYGLVGVAAVVELVTHKKSCKFCG